MTSTLHLICLKIMMMGGDGRGMIIPLPRRVAPVKAVGAQSAALIAAI